jgi:hypothetical protein
MSVKLPSRFDFGVDLDADISGIPTSYSFAITGIPKIAIGLDPIEIKPLEFKPIEIKPLDLSFRIKEIPSVRVHLPTDYRVGLTLLGFELACVRLCGQGQVITEPYVPNRCECGKPIQAVPIPPGANEPAPVRPPG